MAVMNFNSTHFGFYSIGLLRASCGNDTVRSSMSPLSLNAISEFAR
jgi:hypothetical protein